MAKKTAELRRPTPVDSAEGSRWRDLRLLIGSGHKIGLFTLPFLAVGLVLSIARPSLFGVGGPPSALRAVSVLVLAAGIVSWAWSVVLIVTRIPHGELITTGPYSLVKHPLYTSVALLVLPWIGFLFDTWLGVLVGLVLYIGSRMFATEEEATLSDTFGPAWEEYREAVRIPWL